jgi:type I restriction enzyme S subunit
MDSEALQNSIHARKRGGAQPCLYLSEIEQFPFPLPPLAEQHRIVAKIDQLMALCDAMENQITSATAKQTTLLTALMARV